MRKEKDFFQQLIYVISLAAISSPSLLVSQSLLPAPSSQSFADSAASSGSEPSSSESDSSSEDGSSSAESPAISSFESIPSEQSNEPLTELAPEEAGDSADFDSVGAGSASPLPSTSESQSSQVANGSSELLPSGLGGGIREGLVFGVAGNVGYDSNIFLDERDEVSDFTGTFAPSLTYNSAPPGGAETVLSASYSPFLRFFAENSSLNSFDQIGDASLVYRGPVARFSAIALMSQISEAEQFTGGRTQNSQFAFRANGEYQVSDKTSLAMSIGRGSFRSDSFSLADVDTALASVTAYWAVTPLLKVGPSFRYASTDSTSLGDTETLSFVLAADYDVTGLLDVSAFLGYESIDYSGYGGGSSGPSAGFSFRYEAPDLPWSVEGELRYESVQQIDSAFDRGGGGGEARLAGDLGVDYQLSEFTQLILRSRYATIASPDDANQLINVFSSAVGVTHSFGSWTLTGGLGWNLSSYESVRPTTVSRDDLAATNVFLKHRTTVFSDELFLDTSVRYSIASGDREWERLQASTGLGIEF